MPTTQLLVSDNLANRSLQSGVYRYFQRLRTAFIQHYAAQVLFVTPATQFDHGAARRITSRGYSTTTQQRWHDLIVSANALWHRPHLYFSPYFGNAWTRAAEVYPFYDMILELYPAYYPAQTAVIAQKQRALHRATLILAISHSTARDIQQLYPHIPATRIAVTHLGVDELFFEQGILAPPPPRPYFLFTGKRRPYKNFGRLVQAFALSGLARDFDLVVQGTPLNPAEQALIAQHQLAHAVREMGLLTDIQLRDVFRQAVALVVPSEYEGFGLPALEALASGTLVALANTSSLPEVGGTVALYFDPLAVEQIAAALTQLAHLSLTDRQQRIQDGIRHAQQFSWERCVTTTLAHLAQL